MSQYFDQLRADFIELGIANESSALAAVVSYDDLFELVKYTHNIGLGGQPHDSLTPLGQLVSQHITDGVSFQPNQHTLPFQCCVSAEGKLRKSLDKQIVNSNGYASPIILHRDNTPIALIKHVGEPNAYALADDPEFGLIAQTFATPDRALLPYLLPRTAGAVAIDITDLGRVTSTRYSTFVVPPDERKGLRVANGNESLLTLTHGDITEVVLAMFSVAKRYSPKMVKRWQRTTARYYQARQVY